MKKNKIRTMFYTLLALTSVFLFANNSTFVDSAPTITEAEAVPEEDTESMIARLDSEFVYGKYEENYRYKCLIFPQYEFDVYRFKVHTKNGPITLIHKDSFPGIDFPGYKPLPGSISNSSSIKGIMNITISYSGEGLLRYDNRADFAHGYNVPLPYSGNDTTKAINFENKYNQNIYPAYFRIETTTTKFNLKVRAFKVTRNKNLGTIYKGCEPSGYDTMRLHAPKNQNATSNDVYFYDNNTKVQYGPKRTYEAVADYPKFAEYVNQLSLFGTKIKNNYLHIEVPDGYYQSGGYTEAFGLDIELQHYYEYDVPLDNTSGRGVGRLVYFSQGLTPNGYRGDPLIVFTDDHYFTFFEFLNYNSNGKPVFSKRFNAQCMRCGANWTPATTFNVYGSGTKNYNPYKPKPEIKINCEPEVWLTQGESFQLDCDLYELSSTNVIFESENYQIVAVDQIDGLVYASRPGTTRVIAKITNQFGEVIESNPITFRVTNIQSLQVSGTCRGPNYNEYEFNPDGLIVKAIYEDGSVENVDPSSCIWTNTVDNSTELIAGETSIRCFYKGINTTYTDPSLKVLDNPPLESLKINLPSGQLLPSKSLYLDVIVSPIGASKKVRWSIIKNDEVSGSNASIGSDGHLYTSSGKGIFGVSAYSIVTGMSTTNYYEIVDVESYHRFTLENGIEEGEYVLEYEKHLYDPTKTNGSNSIYSYYTKFDVTNPPEGTKILITKSPKGPDYYYMQRSDNRKYLDFNPLDGSINENSIYPVSNYIVIESWNVKIYNEDKTEYLQYNDQKNRFEKCPPNEHNNINIMLKNGTKDDRIPCQGFVDVYMHLTDYTEDLGRCTDWTYNYFGNAVCGFRELTNKQRLEIATNPNYAPAWERFNAWARANHTTIILDSEGNFKTEMNFANEVSTYKNNVTVVVISATVASCFVLFAFYFMINRRSKRNNVRR